MSQIATNAELLGKKTVVQTWAGPWSGKTQRIPVDVAEPAPRPAHEPEDFEWPDDPKSKDPAVCVQFYGGVWHFTIQRGLIVLSLEETKALSAACEALYAKLMERRGA